MLNAGGRAMFRAFWKKAFLREKTVLREPNRAVPVGLAIETLLL
tara:strand:+ start:504 stop:635 length:132 start_codon:yes stop_codon:yes gene_type:complete